MTVQDTKQRVQDTMTDTKQRVQDTVSNVKDRVNQASTDVKDRLSRAGGDLLRNDHSEGPIARRIEEQTAKVPSDTFLWAALGSIGLSLGLQMAGHDRKANFVGHWAPTFLILGLYNKMVKQHGFDHHHEHSNAGSMSEGYRSNAGYNAGREY